MTELPAAETLAEMLEDTKTSRFSLDLTPGEKRMVRELVEDAFQLTGVRLSQRDLIVRGIHMQWDSLVERRSGVTSGRPTKLTAHVQQTILNGLKLGMSHIELMEIVGVSRDTLWRWMNSNTPFSDECQKIEIALRVRRLKRLQRQRQSAAGGKA